MPSPYLGMFFERDLPAGVEQTARKYDAMINKILGHQSGDITVYTSANTFKIGMGLKIDNLAKTDETIKDNIDFLKDMIQEISKEMDFA